MEEFTSAPLIEQNTQYPIHHSLRFSRARPILKKLIDLQSIYHLLLLIDHLLPLLKFNQIFRTSIVNCVVDYIHSLLCREVIIYEIFVASLGQQVGKTMVFLLLALQIIIHLISLSKINSYLLVCFLEVNFVSQPSILIFKLPYNSNYLRQNVRNSCLLRIFKHQSYQLRFTLLPFVT
jgi:hypothetical protein